MKTKHKMIIPVIVAAVFLLSVSFIIGEFGKAKFSVPPKEERLRNMMYYSDIEGFREEDVDHEITLALSRYTNWDNLFLSDRFKKSM